MEKTANGRAGKDAKINPKEILAIVKGKLKMADIADAPEWKPPKWLGSGYTSDLSDWGKFLGDLAAGNIAVGGAGGGGVETMTGDQDDVNKDYTVLHTPKFVTWNGQSLYEGAGYSLAGLVVTMDIAPSATDIIRSHF